MILLDGSSLTLEELVAIADRGAPVALSQQVLRTDASGMPLEWIDYKEAVRLHCLGQVAYAFGSRLYALHGGVNARSGRQTVIEVNSMMATQGGSGNPGSLRGDYVPPLNNETLFRRDANLCMYCGGRFSSSQLNSRGSRARAELTFHVASRIGFQRSASSSSSGSAAGSSGSPPR